MTALEGRKPGPSGPKACQETPQSTLPMSEQPLGFRIELRGQSYLKVGMMDHVKPDGSTVRLIEWSSHCSDCATEFRLRTTDVIRWFSRRCQTCKAPGKRVNPKPRRFGKPQRKPR